MGDQIELVKNCIYCGEIEKKVWYAPTSNSFGFNCKKCKKYNFITTDLKVKKEEDVIFDDVYWAINNASNMMNEKQIKACADDFYKNLKKHKEVKG